MTVVLEESACRSFAAKWAVRPKIHSICWVKCIYKYGYNMLPATFLLHDPRELERFCAAFALGTENSHLYPSSYKSAIGYNSPITQRIPYFVNHYKQACILWWYLVRESQLTNVWIKSVRKSTWSLTSSASNPNSSTASSHTLIIESLSNCECICRMS